MQANKQGTYFAEAEREKNTVKAEKQRQEVLQNEKLEAKRRHRSCNPSALGEQTVSQCEEQALVGEGKKVSFKKKLSSFKGKTSLKDRAEDVRSRLAQSRTKRANDLDPEEQIFSFSDLSGENTVEDSEVTFKNLMSIDKNGARSPNTANEIIQKQLGGFLQSQTGTIDLKDIPLPTIKQLQNPDYNFFM